MSGPQNETSQRRKHCVWCGQFAASTSQLLRFLNIFGVPKVTGPLCSTCKPVFCRMAARNVLSSPSPYLMERAS